MDIERRPHPRACIQSSKRMNLKRTTIPGTYFTKVHSLWQLTTEILYKHLIKHAHTTQISLNLGSYKRKGTCHDKALELCWIYRPNHE